MSYTPTPGTVAYRAIAHLQSLPPGAEIMGAKLAEAIGREPSGLVACLAPAREAGLIFCRQRTPEIARAPLFWSLVDHSATRRPASATSTREMLASPSAGAASAGAEDTNPEPAGTPASSGGDRERKNESDSGVSEYRARLLRALHALPPPDPREGTAPRADDAGLNSKGPGRRATEGREAATAPTPDRPVTEEQRHADERRASAPQQASLVGHNATISLTGEIAIVAECGTVILFDAAKARRLLAFFAGRAAA